MSGPSAEKDPTDSTPAVSERTAGVGKPHATGPKSENPYCMRCSKHLGLAFHETNEHDDARARADLHDEFDAITRVTSPETTQL